jgi:outer membrane lipoprotein-sorting protein
MQMLTARVTGLAALLLAVTLLVAPVGVSAEAAKNSHLNMEARQTLERLSARLRSLSTLKGDFVQVSEAGGMATGKFYLRKPGRLRFEYDPPTPLVLVADGIMVSVEDKELETVNSYPLDATPLKLILDRDVDLINDANIAYVEQVPGEIRVKAVKDDGVAQGEIIMVFAQSNMELLKWTVRDAQEIETTVILQNVEYGMRLSAQLFVPTDYEFEDLRD